jgi:hypothetical protein
VIAAGDESKKIFCFMVTYPQLQRLLMLS